MLNIRIVKCSNLFDSKRLSVTLIRNFKQAFSTQTAVEPTEDKYEKQLKDYETLSTVVKKIRQKKPQKPPFAKNLFLGKFDKDILTYPELQKEDVDILEPAIKLVEKLIDQEHMINCDTLSHKNFRQNLADYKTIGLQAPQLMDGRECNFTESSRFLEALSAHKLRDNIIYYEQLAVQALVRFANDDLKKKYLHPIMKGEILPAFCMYEAGLSDIASVKTVATLTDDKKNWVLNGEKDWVVNGNGADIFIVVAMTDLVIRDEIKEPKLTLLLVEKDSPGISFSKTETDGIEMASVRFKDTLVPEANIIGEVNKAGKILTPLMTEFRLGTGVACLAVTKQIVNQLTRMILQQSNDTNKLHETDAVRGKLGEMITNLYATESLLYLTTGLIDTYENQDCELEASIVKIFSSESCFNASTAALNLVGTPAVNRSHWANKLHTSAVRHIFLHESNCNLKIMAALFGLQHAGVALNDRINKIRNPLFHGGFTLRRMWTNRRNAEDNPKLDLELIEYLHPSLEIASKRLEYCVKRLEFATEVVLARYGPEVVGQHLELSRLAECIVDIYTMTACVGRASRSYCIGLQNSNYEMLLANTFCGGAQDRVRFNVQKIYEGDYATNDENFKAIGKQMFRSKQYFLKHPLCRNF